MDREANAWEAASVFMKGYVDGCGRSVVRGGGREREKLDTGKSNQKELQCDMTQKLGSCGEVMGTSELTHKALSQILYSKRNAFARRPAII